jgi:transcriptional regulator with GAF, ATPase, and Fis domain
MAGKAVELAGPEVRVGRNEKCDFVLDDPTVSQEHVILRIDGDSIRVVDAGSRNGTTVDGVHIHDAYARPDSTIGLGDSALRLKMAREWIDLPISSHDRFGRLMGSSAAMRRAFTLLERIAPTDATVLIEGETGTGKELAAKAIHEASPRAGKPFVVFDCSAVSETLFESELFGHVKGSFTGARCDRMGKFEAAHKGTLFLDELGELPIEMQQKLLRALEAREVTRVGANSPTQVDVRIVAATNRSLVNDVDKGRFRQDLYYRLAVVPVRLPPLRERVDDIPMLARHFETLFPKRECPPLPLTDEAIRRLVAERWPGNVRELKNKVDMILSLGLSGPTSGTDEVRDLLPGPLEVDLHVPLLVALERLNDAYKKAYVEQLLKKHDYNVSRTAKAAGVGRAHIQDLMKRYNITRSDAR